MTAQEPTIQETIKKDQIVFQEILSNDELDALFVKHHVRDERKRKLFVRCFFSRLCTFFLRRTDTCSERIQID